MNTGTTLQISSTSSNATEQLGERLGSRLKGGEVVQLVSDLGGGKTTFVRGLAQGIGSHDHVSSPTFTISKVYRGPKLTLYHLDFYRLPEAGIMRQELEEILGDQMNVAVIEWADIVKDILPVRHMIIEIKVTGEDTREFQFRYDESLAYLVEGIK